MSIRSTLGLALAALLTLPQATPAQESAAPELGELSAVAVWEIEPADLGTLMAVAEKVAKAAGEANLGQEFGWTMWQHGYSITVVSPFNQAELDDPQVWMKQFMGTPGEATFMEAVQDMEGVNLLGAWNEIMQDMPEWSYLPEGMEAPPLAWVHVNEFWLKSGQANFEKWNALVGDFMSFFEDIGYPYPIWGSMVRYGEIRVMFVTAYDDRSEYHGAKSVEALAKEHMAGERWQDLLGRLSQLTTRARDDHYQFLPAQSYLGGSP